MFSYASSQTHFLSIICNDPVSLERHTASICPEPGANLSERSMSILGRAEPWEHAADSLGKPLSTPRCDALGPARLSPHHISIVNLLSNPRRRSSHGLNSLI